VVIALTVATIKATLVTLFFMHLRYDKPVNGVIAAAGFIFLGIFLMFCFIDVGARDNLQPVNLHPPVAAAPAPAAGAPPAGGAPAEGGEHK
jgi:cytochrome c oxidase subunit 4